MNWLAQNWGWIAIAAAVAWFFWHKGMGSRLGTRGGSLLGSIGQAGHGGHGGASGGRDESAPNLPQAGAPEAAVDPVGGEAVRTAQALTSVYQGQIYYFASKENRDRFEAAPQEYAHKAAGYALRPAESDSPRPRRHGGC